MCRSNGVCPDCATDEYLDVAQAKWFAQRDTTRAAHSFDTGLRRLLLLYRRGLLL